MSYFEAKMHQISISAGAPLHVHAAGGVDSAPQTP